MDTDGDNLWDWKSGDCIKTNNARYLMRFQDLCNKYGFKPVWLTNYEMIMDQEYVDFITKVVKSGNGELGMHLHAWNSPPEYELEAFQDGAPYLIEYPPNIIEKKVSYLTNLIYSKTGIVPVSHRAGRWAMNDAYFNAIANNGYLIDCSVTPHINWSSSFGQTKGACGSDYSNCSEQPFYVDNVNQSALLEMPVTIRKSKKFILPDKINVDNCIRSILNVLKGQLLWLRPELGNVNKMCSLIEEVNKSESDYIMFMLHSSELMPGGSPRFPNKESIEQLYKELEIVFRYAKDKGFVGTTLKDYYKIYAEKRGGFYEKV